MSNKKGEYVKDYIKTIKYGLNYYKNVERNQKTKEEQLQK